MSAHAHAEETLKGKLANLSALTSEAGRHGDVMRTLQDQIAVRAARFQEAADARRRDGLDIVFSQKFQDVSEASLGEVGGLLRQIANAEMVNLAQSRSDTEVGRWWLGVGSVTSFLLSALLCVGALLLLRRRLELLKASERVLSAFNAQLELSVRQRTSELEGAKAEIQRRSATCRS